MAVKKGKLIADEAVVRLVNHLGLEAASKKLNVHPGTVSRALGRAGYGVRRYYVPQDSPREILADLIELVKEGIILVQQRPDGQVGYQINPAVRDECLEHIS